jgi:hypothetical protein
MSELARPVTRLEQLRQELPDAARKLTQLAIDNPGQIALITAGMIVVDRVAMNLVRPRNAAEAAALAVVLWIATPYLFTELVRRDAISLRIRDGRDGFIAAAELLRADAADHVHPA